MKLSIIAPVYKVEAYIERFIHSIIRQSHTSDFELIIVDDCGNDRSIEIAKTILEKSSLCYKIVHREKNGGLSAARNTGMLHAQGAYFYFADSDDMIEEGAIAAILNLVEAHPAGELFCLNARFKNIDAEDIGVWRQPNTFPSEMKGSDFLTSLYKGKVGAYIWQYVFHRSIFERVSFKEGSVWEDSIIMPQILSLVDTVYIDDASFIYLYILRPGSITQTVHPQIDAVIPALEEVENRLYPNHKGGDYEDFIRYKTHILMSLSRETIIRTKGDDARLISLHKNWGKCINADNIATMWRLGNKKSAIFLWLTKKQPRILLALYTLKVLK